MDEPETREEGFCWVVLGRNPPEIARWGRSERGCMVKVSRGNRTRPDCVFRVR
jgi:hypothetical protein